jgi:hypothetical protein
LAGAREVQIRKWGQRKKEELLGNAFSLAAARRKPSS